MSQFLTAKELTEGLYFGRPESTPEWELVYAQDESYRPSGWFKEGYPKIEVFFMAWDIGKSSHDLADWVFVRAKYIHSDNPRIESE